MINYLFKLIAASRSFVSDSMGFLYFFLQVEEMAQSAHSAVCNVFFWH